MIYLFAHSTQQGWSMSRKNAVFYLLGELENGDVIFINYNGQIYTYKVYQKKIFKPEEADILGYNEKDKEVLLLQTCWPIGTDWNRLVVFAERYE
jgi:LPXTG-site transpeptidase (sortase) family protein